MYWSRNSNLYDSGSLGLTLCIPALVTLGQIHVTIIHCFSVYFFFSVPFDYSTKFLLKFNLS